MSVNIFKNGVLKKIAGAVGDALPLANNLLTTVPGSALDATQGTILDEKVSQLNRNLNQLSNRTLIGSGSYVDISSIHCDFLVAVKGLYDEIAMLYVPYSLINNEFIVSATNVDGVHNSWIAKLHIDSKKVSTSIAYMTNSNSFIGTEFTPTLYVYA